MTAMTKLLLLATSHTALCSAQGHPSGPGPQHAGHAPVGPSVAPPGVQVRVQPDVPDDSARPPSGAPSDDADGRTHLLFFNDHALESRLNLERRLGQPRLLRRDGGAPYLKLPQKQKLSQLQPAVNYILYFL
jgi:hypothetical protein